MQRATAGKLLDTVHFLMPGKEEVWFKRLRFEQLANGLASALAQQIWKKEDNRMLQKNEYFR